MDVNQNLLQTKPKIDKVLFVLLVVSFGLTLLILCTFLTDVYGALFRNTPSYSRFWDFGLVLLSGGIPLIFFGSFSFLRLSTLKEKRYNISRTVKAAIMFDVGLAATLLMLIMFTALINYTA
jgi:hypothetical protein